MIAVSVRQSVYTTRLHCAKTAEQIGILFRVNTLGGPRNIMLNWAPDPPQRRGGELRKILPTVDPLHISRLAEARNLKFCVDINWLGSVTTTVQK